MPQSNSSSTSLLQLWRCRIEFPCLKPKVQRPEPLYMAAPQSISAAHPRKTDQISALPPRQIPVHGDAVDCMYQLHMFDLRLTTEPFEMRRFVSWVLQDCRGLQEGFMDLHFAQVCL